MEDTSVIKPFPMGKPIGPVAVMAATRPDVKLLSGLLGLGREPSRDFFHSRLYAPPEGRAGVSLVGPFMGAPYAVMLLENLICLGVSSVVFFGWCGSVSPDARTGDILIPGAAFADDGVSRNYATLSPDGLIIPESSLIAHVKITLTQENIPYKTGPCWTTDAIYRETPEKIDHFRGKGALAVDMEVAALMAVAAFRGIQLAAVLVVSDEVWTHTWKPGFSKASFKEGRKGAAQAIATLTQRIV